MTTVLQSWKESLSIFIPRNFKLFTLVTLKRAWDSSIPFLKFAWWQIIGVIWLWYAMRGYTPEMVRNPWSILGIIVSSFLILLVMMTALITLRPSIELKDMHYYWRYAKELRFKVWGLIVIYLLLAALMFVIVTPLAIAAMFAYGWIVALIRGGTNAQSAMLELAAMMRRGPFLEQYFPTVFPFGAMQGVMILFILDAQSSFISVKRGVGNWLRFIWYNAPFFVVLAAFRFTIYLLLFFGVYSPAQTYLGGMYLYGFYSVRLLLHIAFSFICYAAITNFYTKRIYEQGELYLQ